MMENYSLSDVALATGGLNGGFGGMGGWGGLILGFLGGAILSNGGLFGGWGNQRGNVATTEDLASGFNFSALQNKTNDILAAVNNNNQVLGNAICQLGYQDAQHAYELSRQLADCCCTTQRGIDSVKFDMANYASAIQMNDTANTQKVLDKLCAMESAQKDAVIAQQGQRIAALEADARMCGIPRTSPYGYGIYAYPTCGNVNAYGCNSCANI